MNPFLTTDPIDAAALLASVASPHAGGAVLFVGTVRDLTGPEVTEALEYHAYAAMAEHVAADIRAETLRTFPVVSYAHVHRLGHLIVGETSVAVAVSCAHRAEAFAAARFAIDEIKRRAPVWKRDIPPGGSPQWIHPESGS